jgi:hypothetical protein
MNKNHIVNNINIIIDNNMTWTEAIEEFDIHDINLQKVYMRYIIKECGYMKALLLLENDDMVQDEERGAEGGTFSPGKGHQQERR